jgi:hypothetical protein
MSDVTQTTHLDPERGLWIPPEARPYTQVIVIRTPRATMQIYGDPPLGAYHGMIGRDHFNIEKIETIRNKSLLPDKVSIKPAGKEPFIYRVTGVGA